MSEVRKWREFRCPVRSIAEVADCHADTVRNAVRRGELDQGELLSVIRWVMQRNGVGLLCGMVGELSQGGAVRDGRRDLE